MKRLISIMLCLVLVTTVLVLPVQAANSYSSLITGVLEDLEKNDQYTSGAPQQSANGAYRLTEMLAIIASEGASSSAYTDLITDTLDRMTTNDSFASGAPQQLANGSYRIAEMLAVIALERDKTGV